MGKTSLLSHYTPVIANIGLLVLVAWVFTFFNQRFRPQNHEEGVVSRINIGLLFGTASVLVMLMPFYLQAGVFADTRGVLLLASGLIGGLPAAAVSALISAVARYLMGGQGMMPGIMLIVVFAGAGVLAHAYWLTKRRFQFRVWQIIGLCILATAAALPSVLLLPETLQYSAVTELFPLIFIANGVGAFVLAGLLSREEKRRQEHNVLESSRQALQHSDLMLRGMLNSMPAEVALLAADGTVQYVNSAWENFESDAKDPADMNYLGMNYLDVCRLNPDEPDFEVAGQVLRGMEALLGSKRTPFEQIYPCHSGQLQRWFKLIANPVADVPGVSAVTMHLEVTELVLAQLELEKEKERAETANIAKTLFLSSMSHELTTPLHSILGFGQLLAGDNNQKASARRGESLQQILQAGRTLLDLVTQVLDFSKIELGNDQPKMEDVALGPVIDASVGMMKYEADNRNISLLVKSRNYDSQLLHTDSRRLKQVLIQLLTNGIRFSPAGTSIIVSCEKRGDSFMRIIVTDSGMGIPAIREHEIFEPFVRLGRERGNIQGSGIGLTIARRLIESIGGTIDFESQEGEGSRFWVDVPCANVHKLEG